MTVSSGAAANSGDALRDWEAVRASAEIQYAPLPPFQIPAPPGWLVALQAFLKRLLEPLGRALGVSWPVIEMILIGLAALGVLFLAWRIGRDIWARRRPAKPAADPQWTPDRAAAMALLEDADRLAAAGDFDEATHLLLRRSVGEIAIARPDWLGPASTAREIAALPMLPAAARGAFATIAARVERSRYALHRLGAEDWQAARDAYAAFALADLKASGA